MSTTPSPALSSDETIVLVCGCGAPSRVVRDRPTAHRSRLPRAQFPTTGGSHRHRPRPRRTRSRTSSANAAVFDQFEIAIADFAGHSLGGWIAETPASDTPTGCKPPRFSAVATRDFLGEGDHDRRARSRELDYELPPLFFATGTVALPPDPALQEDTTVDTWLALPGDPGRGPTQVGSASTRRALRGPTPPYGTGRRFGCPASCSPSTRHRLAAGAGA